MLTFEELSFSLHHLILPRDLHTWPLHVTFARDLYTWPLHVTSFSSTQFVELSWLNTSSRFRQKHNFLKVPKIHCVSTWHIMGLPLFTLSIFFGHLLVLVLLLGWPFYRIPCICYPTQFRKDKGKDVLALLDFGSEVNSMTPAYAAHLDLKVKVTDVGV